MLFSDLLTNHFRLTEKQKNILDRSGFKTVSDLLRHFPARYEKFCEPKAVADLIEGDEAAVSGKVIGSKTLKTWRKKMAIAETMVSDGTGTLSITWFNQPYMANILSPEKIYSFSGKIQKNKKGLYMANPNYTDAPIQLISGENQEKLTPVYPETRGLHSKWFQFAIKKILKPALDAVKDPLPEEILKRYHLPALKTALLAIHRPKDQKMAEAARKRFAFEEIFLIQLDRQKKRMERDRLETGAIEISKEKIKEFQDSVPYALTSAQKKASSAILEDMNRPKPMSRLLEGDVGSGKTIVAAMASYAAALNRKQTAYMAPTEVLARQHYREFIERFKPFGLPVALATSAEFRKFPSKAYPGKDTHIAKNQLLGWVESGEIPILIGTHALVQDKIKFKDLGLVIIDEQHRFGVNQRARLTQKFPSTSSVQAAPHLLSMTATPIPRTLALTIYGDLDLTLLDEMPPGRKKVITVIVPPSQRSRAYEQMRSEIQNGRQAFVVCPRIEENSNSNSGLALEINPVRKTANIRNKNKIFEENPDKELSNGVKSVKAEHKKLSEKIFPEFKVGMLHGQMALKEKEKIMNEFHDNKIRILVATSVIEVGINVPNATIIMIEGAERFGLAQLHQLRGRVLRSIHQPYCFIFTESPAQKTMARLRALGESKNGFELAEYDLRFRGSGELSGGKQWGISDIGMEALKNIKMVEAARAEAQKLLEKDLELSNYPELKPLVSRFKNIHFE
jgi:ATP-dependent DNA helicase RecG